MMQQSVYSKLVLNNNSTKLLREQIIKNLPISGIIQLMTITEKQYSDIEFLVGKNKNKVIDTIERVVVL